MFGTGGHHGEVKHRRKLRFLAAVVLFGLALLPSAARAESISDHLDLTFGTDGAVMTNAGEAESGVSAAVQPDGRILIGFCLCGGETEPGFTRPEGSFGIARLLPSGKLDPSFGHGGFSFIKLGTPSAPKSILIQKTGEILALAESDSGMAAVRLLPNGALDPSFGHDGIANIPTSSNGFIDGVLLPDGRIVMGVAGAPATVARLTPDGQLDPSFGEDGIVTDPRIGGGYGGLVVLSNGEVALAGIPPEGGSPMVVRWLADGELDEAFGMDGAAPTGAPADVISTALLALPNGDLVTLGYSDTIHVGLYALRNDGSVDTNWGTNGSARLSAGEGTPFGLNGLVTPAGNIYVTGSGNDFRSVLMARFSESGMLESKVAPQAPLGDHGVNGVWGIALQPDGRVIATGDGWNGSGLDALVLRFAPEGAPPEEETFDTDPPRVSCKSADGAWHDENVSITCTAVDDGSGLANPADADFTLTTAIPYGGESADAATDSRQVCDQAGNCTTAGPVSGNAVDRRSPTIGFEQAPDGQNGWFVSTPATLTVVATDVSISSLSCTLDGRAVPTTPSAAPQTLTMQISIPSEGHHTISCSALDEVGHEGEGSDATLIDLTAPQRPHANTDREPDYKHWFRNSITVVFSGGADPRLADRSPGSGVDPASLTGPQSFTASGIYLATGTVSDLAGNTSAAETLKVHVDADPPTSVLTCPTDPRRGSKAFAKWRDVDGESGLKGSAKGRETVDTSIRGLHVATHVATDHVGHATESTCSYRVL